MTLSRPSKWPTLRSLHQLKIVSNLHAGLVCTLYSQLGSVVSHSTTSQVTSHFATIIDNSKNRHKNAAHRHDMFANMLGIPSIGT